jgi:hypothetical protein
MQYVWVEGQFESEKIFENLNPNFGSQPKRKAANSLVSSGVSFLLERLGILYVCRIGKDLSSSKTTRGEK